MRWIDKISCDGKACGISNWRLVVLDCEVEEVTREGQDSAMSYRVDDNDDDIHCIFYCGIYSKIKY